jgi:endoglucanase
MALLMAKSLWGDDSYQAQAVSTLNSIMNLEVTGSGSSLHFLPGNQQGDNRDYVAYYAPAYFRVFAELTSDATWTALGDAYYTRLLANQCSANGQIYDDFANPSGECKFWWDSCRVPWRVALDYAWHEEPRAAQFVDKLSGFIGSDPSSVSDQKNSAFVGGAALSAISHTDPSRMQSLCTSWATATLDDTPYLQKTLKLLYLMVAGGKFARPF